MKKQQKKPVWMDLFADFIGNMTISSKELDSAKPVPLLDVLYTAQYRFLQEVADGLDRGIHDFKCLKSRQMGISTISLALDVFWASVHDRLQGSLITDTDGNRDKFRILLEQYIESLPRGLRVGIKQHNRNNLVLMNGSVIDYLVAGVKGKKGSLGTSRALNFLHATEVSNWGSTDADIANLQASLAEKHPHRLYIWESTARGFGNEWYEMCDKAREDDQTQKLFFIGWFLNENYSFEENSPEFGRWWDGKLTEEEEEIQKGALEESGWLIKPKQWAWHRYMRTMKILDPDLMRQNYPSTAREAFIMTGRSFFPLQKIGSNIQAIHEAELPLKAYRYHMGQKFTATEIELLDSTKEADLRIWEEPNPNGSYVMGVDTAYGREDKDRHGIEVYRCYADKIVQVAEFCTGIPETYQATWAMAHLAGCYRNVIINLEVNGPGFAVMDELRHLKQLLDNRLIPGLSTSVGNIEDLFSSVRWFLYHKPDSMGAGYVYNWKCLSLDTKLPTPSGWTTMGEAKVGDPLFDANGGICRVVKVSPVMIGRKCYRVHFDDGSSIVTDENHEWKVCRPNLAKWNGESKIRTTKELKPGKHCIEVANSLDGFETPLPIHPYVLGVWLGDGYSQSGYYFAGDDIEELGNNIKDCGYELGPVCKDRTVNRQMIKFLTSTLRQNDLIQNKHIPAIYLRASRSQRFALLQGLMDTDGSSGGNGGNQCSFTTSSAKLRDGFSELLRSLGFKAKFCVRNRILNYAGGQSVCEPAYQFWFTARENVFRLKRKQQSLVTDTPERRRYHRIVKVEEVPSVPVKCLEINSPTHLYLAGEGMVPTHNTNSENKLMIMNQLRDTYAVGGMLIHSIPLLEEMERVVQDGSQIQAEGRAHDDRVFASALACHAWIQWVRAGMIQTGQTYERVTEEERISEETPQASLIGGIVSDFFQRAASERMDEEERQAWNT